jgi:hypothetical protein
MTLSADEYILSTWRQDGQMFALLKSAEGVVDGRRWLQQLRNAPAGAHVYIVDNPQADALIRRVPSELTTSLIPYAGWLHRAPFTTRKPPVVLGDPDGSLPAAHAEATEVAAFLGVQAKSRATIDDFVRLVDHAAVFHYAGHGVLTAQDPFETHLRLSNRTRLRLVDVLTHRPRIGLTVLSGCETGSRAALAGEHAVGLAQAFLTAGTERVLAATRPVDDRATRAFMQRFYAAGGARTPALALRAVQPDDGPWRLWGRR